MHSPDLVAGNIEKIAALFPNCITEAKDATGKLTRAVDFDLLKQELSGSVVEGPQERYRLDWPGKREALLAANAPIAKTLRPRPQQSLDFEKTKNIFIEGDNLDALKLLQEYYLGRVKLIYIDPPYNTGNDFLYEDKFSTSPIEYLSRSNQQNSEGGKLVLNTESNGRWHTDWLNMMHPRIKLARNLLREDGVIIISIDDHEASNLKKVCDEIFGAQNFISSVSRMMKSGGAKGKFFTPNIEYALIYAKDIASTKPFRAAHTQDQIEGYYNKKQVGGSRDGELYGEERLYKASLDPRANQRYWIKCPDGSFCIPPGKNFPPTIIEGEKITPSSEDGVWKWTYARYRDELNSGNIVFKETSTTALVTPSGEQSKYNIYNKLWLRDQQEKGLVPSNFIGDIENRQSATELKDLSIPFPFAKPTALIRHFLSICGVSDNDIVLDFFSGSASSAHAVMAQNIENDSEIRYILIQLPEACDVNSEAYKSGFKTISELASERIKRAASKLKKENPLFQNADFGFRFLCVETSNFSEVYYTPDAIMRDDLLSAVSNIREDRTSDDLLFQVMLDWGVDLGLPISSEIITGKKVFFVDGNALAACFDTDVSEELVTALAKRRLHDLPLLKVVFRDGSYASDSAKINVEQIFKLLSPTTELRTL